MSGASPGDHTNFSQRNNKKPQTRIEVEKIPAVKKEILIVIDKDSSFWDEKGLKQLGVEKFNLLKKVSKNIKINSNVFELALSDLELDQEILPIPDGNFVRFIKLRL